MKLLNNLPDDCLRLIFYRVPLSDRIYLYRVCPRWGSLQSSVTTTIKSLTLHIATTEPMSQAFTKRSSLDIPYIDPADQPYKSPLLNSQSLTFPALTPNITAQLITLLPNIESLQLNFKLSAELTSEITLPLNIELFPSSLSDQLNFKLITEITSNIRFINQLLQGWSDKLVTFEFNCWRHDVGGIFCDHKEYICCPKEMLTIFEVLDRDCLKLENISINSEEEFGLTNGYYGSNLHFPSLQRLKNFRFNSHDYFDFLFDSLIRYATGNAALKRIHIGKCIWNCDHDPRMTTIDNCLHNSTLIRKFTAIPGNPSNVLKLSKFINLTTLSVGLHDFLKVTAQLAKLTNLVHLVLYDYNKVFENTLQDYEQTESYTFHQLPSVKVLCIKLTDSQTKLQSKHWPWILPSIKLVELQQFDMYSSKNARDWETHMETMKKNLQSLKQCHTLKRVVAICLYSDSNSDYNYKFNVQNSKEWKIEDL